VEANLFDSGLRQEKATLASTKADSPSLPECKNLLLSAQKQLLELPLSLHERPNGSKISKKSWGGLFGCSPELDLEPS
jgi:hypothetical protein